MGKRWIFDIKTVTESMARKLPCSLFIAQKPPLAFLRPFV